MESLHMSDSIPGPEPTDMGEPLYSRYVHTDDLDIE